MYFILSKVLLFVLFPLNWMLIFLLIAFFTKRPKRRKRCYATAIALFIIFSNPLLLYLFAQNWDIYPEPFEKGKVYSAAIVLGGFSGEDKNGNGVFNSYSDRFIEGIRLKGQNKASHILISSGNGNLQVSSFREATWAEGVLKQLGVPDSAILIEHESRNTFENAAFSKKLLQQKHLPPPYLLVTSAWHMRRAQYIFKKEGLQVIARPSGMITGNQKFSFWDSLIPDVGVLSEWPLYLKELVGIVVAHLK
ncbi:MAG TPA: YdcF family protein [Mucilaginibacter sp.]|nr:YdcF family protein [Mucilaginibacter sp.]